MTMLKRLTPAVLALGLFVSNPGSGIARQSGYYDRNGGDLRGLVDRTQSDLRAASDLEHGNKQHDRYKNAQDHLSDFDRSLSKGKFDKGRLDTAIADIQHLLDHNTLQASSRDALREDVDQLRMARQHH
jgi:hypothetical protein